MRTLQGVENLQRIKNAFNCEHCVNALNRALPKGARLLEIGIHKKEHYAALYD